MSKQAIKCSVFHCWRTGDRRCCQGCKNPCEKQCQNSPDKCKLVYTGESVHQARRPAYPPFDEAAARALFDQGLTDAEIGERLGIHKNTVLAWRKKNKMGTSPKEARKR